jgi:hypothetical protein
MRTVKSLVLSSAAALVVVGGAQAADLPVKAKPVEYVRICSLYGAGFYYMPGTDTCIKFGGYAQSDWLANTNSDNTGNVSTQAGAKNRYTNGYMTRARADLNIDTRTATEYGVLRTYYDMVFTWTTDSYFGTGDGRTVYSPLGSGTTIFSAPNNGGAGAVAGGTLGVYHAFIQWAGFTLGHTYAPFSMPWQNYPGDQGFDGLVGGGGTVTGVNQFTYTWDLGAGNSVSLGAVDQTQYYQAGVMNLGGPGPLGANTIGILGVTGGGLGVFGGSDYGGPMFPDIQANFRSDTAAYTWQVSGALHNNHVAYYGINGIAGSAIENNNHPDDLWGGAVSGGFTIKNIPTGPGDTIKATATATWGATRYNIQDLASGFGAVSLYGPGSSSAAAYSGFALAVAPDTAFVVGSNQHAITTFGGNIGYNHNWNPYWGTGFYGAAAAVRYGNDNKLAICGPFGNGFQGTIWSTALGATALVGLDGVAGHGICNPDYNIYQAGVRTTWTPVPRMSFSGEITWQGIQQKFEGLTTLGANAALGKPTTFYEFHNEQNVILLLRARRIF